MQTPTEDHDSAQMTDPVCGMKVSTESEFSFEFDDTRYFFCCQGCAQKFSTDPAGYLSGEAQQTAAMAEPVAGALYICPMDPEVEQDHPGSCPICGMALEVAGASVLNTRTEYTCPMHPEILQDEPGLCPKCGMALEPRTIEIEEKNEELIDMSRRFWISVVLALPVFLLANDENGAMDRVRICHASSNVVRLAFLRAWLAIGEKLESQYVYANRHRCWRGLGL
jgi:Cu+-exporting ATPase